MGKKIVTVVGATGSQGGGLVRAILADRESEFAVRAVTRNSGSAKAQALAELGAEVVQADINDAASLGKAFEGAYGAFLVTDFWAHMSAAKELAEVEALVQAVRGAGVQHVVWSTLEDTRELLPVQDPRMPVLDGKYNVPHFDAKGEADDLFRKAGVPTTFLRTTFYFEGLLDAMAPRRAEDGVLTLALPLAPGKLLAGIAAEDIGRTAYGILKSGEELVGETVSIAGEYLTGEQYAAALAEALGEPVRFQSVPFDDYRALDFAVAREIGNMFHYYSDFDREFTGARDLAKVRELNPALQDLRAWLAHNGSKLTV
ncbi:uncharacterized protein YbjT (DUF2867 family) [Crossiella equi]|uniref:Uncharacterized protein YbjT (DUF2867 family) n=1 Tax=Crossiella equi TaxID=130796 RepID=A0ABS5A7Q7_9PSEU|nr:NmrA/HSCARG family protein [Crossiella equi]MBP2472628.1 uncharacterized protein YbjT (DUF2867 family) [Crossiella equi]